MNKITSGKGPLPSRQVHTVPKGMQRGTIGSPCQEGFVIQTHILPSALPAFVFAAPWFASRPVPSLSRSVAHHLSMICARQIHPAGHRCPAISTDSNGFALNFSDSTLNLACYAKPKSSSKNGGTITTPNDHIVLWDIAHLRQRPSSGWTKGQSCTSFQFGPLKRGCSGGYSNGKK